MSAERHAMLVRGTDLDTRLLRYVLAVVREGSIRGAAARLNVAASAVSRQVAEFEARLGLPLFERTTRGVVPTEAGRAVAEHARQQMEDGERLIDHLRQLHGLRRGAVRIACGEGFMGDLVENALRPFAAACPGVGVQLVLGTTADILAAVAEGAADLGLAYDPPPMAGVRSTAVSRQPMCLVAAPGHAGLAAGPPSLQDIAGQHLALPTAQHGIRRLIALVEADLGFHLVPDLESNSIDVLRRFAMAGLGVTVLPAFAAATELAAGRLGAVPLADPALAQAGAHLLVRSRRRLPETVARMAAIMTGGMRAFQD